MSDTNQPIWKLLWSTDTTALYVDTTGVYDPEIAALEDQEDGKFLVFRVSLEGCKLVDGILVWGHYKPTHPHAASQYQPWFADDLPSIASSVGRPVAEITEDLCSSDPSARADAYQTIAGYRGWHEFDQDPQEWFSSEVDGWPDKGPMQISLSRSDDDDGMVTIFCSDKARAKHDQSIEGSHWEAPSDLDTAYARVSDRPDLLADLEKEGYDVDSGDYSPPDDEDMRYWHAKHQHSEGASVEQLSEIMGWRTLDDVRRSRRVREGARSWWSDEREAYWHACYEAGWPVDAERWIDAHLAAQEAV